MILKWKKQKIKCLGLALLILPLMPPEGGDILFSTLYDIIFKTGKLLSLGIILFLFVLRQVKCKMVLHNFIIYFMIMFIVNIVITILKEGDVLGCIKAYIPSIGMILLIEIFDKNLNEIILVAYTWLEVLIWFNLVFVLLYPDGMYRSNTIAGYTSNWLLGYKSSLQYYILPGCCFAAIRIWLYERKYRALLFILASHIQTYLAANKMLMVGLIIFDLLVVIQLCRYSRLFNILNYFLVSLFANILFLFLSYDKIPFISYFLNEILHKNLDTARVVLWKKTIEWIKNAWFIGYGRTSEQIRLGMYGKVAHTHNEILEVTFQGG